MKYLLPLLLIFFACETDKSFKDGYHKGFLDAIELSNGLIKTDSVYKFYYDTTYGEEGVIYHDTVFEIHLSSGDDYLEYYSYYDSVTGEVVHGNNWAPDSLIQWHWIAKEEINLNDSL